MSVVGKPNGSLRQDQTESSRLVWALILSLVFHVLSYGGYELGKRYQLWDARNWPAWMHAPKLLTEIVKKFTVQPPPPQPERETPLMFVNVSPAQATAEAPKNAKFYSSQNSLAANPEPNKNSDVPNIGGKQTQVVRTEDVPRQKFTPLQPSPRPAPQAKEEQEEQKARPSLAPGDLAMAKPDLTPRKDEGGQAEHTRPRTIQEAKARQQQNNRLSGEKMKQDGGVNRQRDFIAMDTKATAFGAYDAALIEAIESRWYSLLDERDYASDGRGRVVLQFTLLPDGRITEMREAENSVGEVLGLICQKAVRDPSPYPSWPSDMRHEIGEARHIQFTFYYN